MQKKVIKVTYQGPIDKELDDKIIKGLESVGLKWYAQGTDVKTQIRDIAFDYIKKG